MKLKIYLNLLSPLLLFLLSSTSTVAAESLTFIHQDHLGSTVLVTSDAGQVVNKEVYYPYGITRKSYQSSAVSHQTTERKYTGQISDTDQTDLYYYNSRYYNPAIAKFIQSDTEVELLNRYAYVRNNPITLIDPSGHYSVRDTYRRYLPNIEDTYKSQLSFLTTDETQVQDQLFTTADIGLQMATSDTVPLTPWGENMQNLYQAYQDTPGWWNNNTAGEFTELQFAELILAYEFTGLEPLAEYNDPRFRSDLAETATHWYYSKCAYESGSSCSGITPNAIFNWVGGGMEIAQRLWRGVFLTDGILNPTFDPETVTSVTPSNQGAFDLANYVVNSLVNPPDPLWTQWQGREIVERPFYWGNPELMDRQPPQKYLWKIGTGPTAFYLMPIQ